MGALPGDDISIERYRSQFRICLRANFRINRLREMSRRGGGGRSVIGGV